MINFFRISIILATVAIACSCATPSAPTGGPRDEEGPEIIQTEPETGTVNFDGDKIVLHFSEFVERSSLSEALTIEPDAGLVYDIDWGRKSVAIEFDKALPDLTTLIVTIGTDFSDLNGNNLASPYKVAVSTGPDIDEGKLTGRILDAQTGEGAEGQRVLLYRTPADFAVPANYIGETDTSGTVNFSYLRQGEYKAFWVDDRNRNKIWEPERERAQPFSKEMVTLAKAGSDTLGTLFIADSDTSLPELQGLGLFSNRRLRLRFSENVVLNDSTRLSIRDTLGNAYAGAYPLYVEPSEEYVLFAQSEKDLAPEQSYRLVVHNIGDVADNNQPETSQTFTGSGQQDTTAQRIVGTPGINDIFPHDPVEVTYAAPITKAAVRDSIKVVQGDTLIQPWPHLEVERNKVRIFPEGRWNQGTNYEIRLWNPISESHRSITPSVLYDSDLGALNVKHADTAARPTHLLLKNDEGELVADTVFTGEIEIKDLAPVAHQLILFQDLDGNGEWSAGTVAPYKKPEPYYIRNGVPVQRGLTSDLTVEFENL